MSAYAEFIHGDISREDLLAAVELDDAPRGSLIDRILGVEDEESDEVEVGEYAKWLEKIVVDAEPVWICEDTPCPEWCSENCSYASIQVECLRHIYGERREP